jgi:plastocyanin
VVFGAAFALAALLLPGTAGADDPKLNGTVGPGFEIALVNAQGVRVTQLDPGPYEIEIQDVSAEHNFHLSGPSVDMRTEVEFEGTVTWKVTLVEGRYNFLCNPHASIMRGAFIVGNPPPLPPPPPPPPPPAPQTRANGTVGPGYTISLRTPAGARVQALRAGQARITVRDRSRIHNFHLVGPGMSRKTSVPFVGSRTWQVRIRAGATYRFLCDPHARLMRGTFRGRP